MQYKCDFCNDTGSLDQDEYLNCVHCAAADGRVALNTFVRSLGVNLTLDERTWAIHQRALAMAPKQEAPHGMAFIGMVGSEQFKYVLEQLATGQPNPKERRRLVREVRDAIKLCAASQIKESAETLSVRDWIKVEDRLPEPYEEVRILFDGVPRIARLCHNRQYFQLATFIDSTKSQYIAIFDKVDGWMPIALAPTKDAAPAAANGALTDEQILIIRDTSSHSAMERLRRMLSPGEANIAFARAILAAAGPDAAMVKALQKVRDYHVNHHIITEIDAALSGAKGN